MTALVSVSLVVIRAYSLQAHWHKQHTEPVEFVSFLEMNVMSNKKIATGSVHTSAWVAQTYVSFFVSLAATLIGVFYMPGSAWLKGYMGMGVLFSIASTASLSKTIRDVEESKTMMSRIDEAKLERLLAEYDPFKG